MWYRFVVGMWPSLSHRYMKPAFAAGSSPGGYVPSEKMRSLTAREKPRSDASQAFSLLILFAVTPVLAIGNKRFGISWFVTLFARKAFMSFASGESELSEGSWMRFSSPFLLVLAFSCVVLPAASSAVGYDDAWAAIFRAQSSIETAYGGVVEAERAGGDVSRLIADLNGALETLSSARRSLDEGDYGSASNYAIEAERRALAVSDGARLMRDEASRVASNVRVLIGISLAVLLVALGVFSHFGLRWLRNRRVRETMRMGVEEGSAE